MFKVHYSLPSSGLLRIIGITSRWFSFSAKHVPQNPISATNQKVRVLADILPYMARSVWVIQYWCGSLERCAGWKVYDSGISAPKTVHFNYHYIFRKMDALTTDTLICKQCSLGNNGRCWNRIPNYHSGEWHFFIDVISLRSHILTQINSIHTEIYIWNTYTKYIYIPIIR